MVKVSIRAQEVGDESCNKMTKRELLASRFCEKLIALQPDTLSRSYIELVQSAVIIADKLLRELYPPEHEEQ